MSTECLNFIGHRTVVVSNAVGFVFLLLLITLAVTVGAVVLGAVCSDLGSTAQSLGVCSDPLFDMTDAIFEVAVRILASIIAVFAGSSGGED